MKININRSQRTIILYSIGIIILSLIFILFMFNPLIKNTMRKRKRLTTKVRTLERQTAEINEIKRIAAECDILKKEIEEYPLIKEEKISSFILNSLLKASNKSGVEFISIEPLIVRDKDIFKYLKLEAKIKSGFHELGKFISEIRRLNGLFFVDNIEIGNRDKISGIITSNLEISVYILIEE